MKDPFEGKEILTAASGRKKVLDILLKDANVVAINLQGKGEMSL